MKLIQALGASILVAVWLGAGCGGSNSGSGTPSAGGTNGNGAAAGDTGTGATDSGGTTSTGSAAGDTGSGGTGTGGVVFECGLKGDACDSAGDCCGGLCATDSSSAGAPSTGTCSRNPDECLGVGYVCGSNLDCCNGNCADGVCSEEACLAEGVECSEGGNACCSGECVDGSCADVNGELSCKVSGNACSDNADCCSKLCDGGICQRYSSYCVQSGDTCTADSECCQGVCDKGDGATYGYCRKPTVSTNACGGDLLAGEVCDSDCKRCCSRSCAPNHTGVFVCQLSGGCRPSGETCTRDTDCCGGAEITDLPGSWAGSAAICKKESADDPYGICEQKGGCTPRGDTCKYSGDGSPSCSTSSLSSKPSNCCPTAGSPKGQCELDPLLVPRCGVGDPCREAGQTCASGADCCNGNPCVPDESGTLRCNDDVCVDDGGTCTVTADCCAGGTCTVPAGSVFGTCTSSEPPDGSGGSPGSGGEPGSGGSGGSGEECTAYGQICSETSECCFTESGVTCIGGRCVIEG